MSIEAMKQALEAMTYFAEEGGYTLNALGKIDAAIPVLRTAIEQAEKSNIKQVIHLYDEPPAAPVQDGNAFFKQFQTGLMDVPPAAQRQWVGLTQQDIDIAFDDTQEGGGFNEFARTIEAKLKEKNNG